MHRLVFTAVCVLAVSAIAASCSNKAEKQAAVWRTEFDRQLGSRATRDDVLRFLRERNLKPLVDDKRNVIRASAPDLDRNLITRSGVYLTFEFDPRGSLKKYEIQAVHTGP